MKRTWKEGILASRYVSPKRQTLYHILPSDNKLGSVEGTAIHGYLATGNLAV